jgi:DNA polymerase-3 subunit epsilon
VVTFDLESTGLNPQRDRITQIAVKGGDGAVWSTLVNPGVPIPPPIQALTGITDAAVASAPRFADIAAEVAGRLAGRTLVGFGCWGLDIPLLAEEFERAGVAFDFGEVIDVGELYKRVDPRNLTAGVRKYLGAERAAAFAAVAHGAVADAEATWDLFRAMIQAEDQLRGLSPAELAAKSARDGHPPADPYRHLVRIDGTLCYAHRTVRNLPVAEDWGYAEWMLRADFPAATKRVLRAELDRLDAEREAVEDDGLFEFRDGPQAGGRPA